MNPTIYGYERYINWASQGKLGPDLSCQLMIVLMLKEQMAMKNLHIQLD